MFTYNTGAKSAPAAAAAYAQYLTESSGAPSEQMGLAEYYLRSVGAAEAVANGMAAIPVLRGDVDPELAAALRLEPGKFIDTNKLGNVLAGYAADGSDLPGSQHNVRTYKAPRTKAGAEFWDHVEGLARGGKPPGAGEGGEEGKERERIAFFDFTLSAPKSVSLIWAFAGTEAERASILQAHVTAREETLRYVETEIARAHFGHGRDENRTEKGTFAWVTVNHFAARPTVAVTRPDPTTGVMATELYQVPGGNGLMPGDPQLHSHCIVPNLMRTESGRFVAINGSLLAGRIHEFGAVYQMVLARELRKMGVDVEMDARTKTARATCVPEDVCEEFSKRTKDAEASAKRHYEQTNPGRSWDELEADTKIAFLKGGAASSRRSKVDDMEQFAAWAAQAARIGWKHVTAIAYGPTMKPRTRDEMMDAAQGVTDGLFAEELSRRAVLKGTDARLAAARGMIAEGGDAAQVSDVSAITRNMAKAGVVQDGQLTRLVWREENGRATRITTELHASQEREVLNLSQKAVADSSHSIPREWVDVAADKLGIDYSTRFGAMQRDVARRMADCGALGVFIGVHGVGKTTRILPPIIEALKQNGADVWGTAIGWKQSRALREAGIEHHRQKALQPLLDGLRDGSIQLTEKSVVVVDELSLIGTRQFLDLLRHRQAMGFKIIATGDERQCQSIEAGPIISLLRRALGEEAVPSILETVRQNSKEERETALMFRNGQAKEAIARKRAAGNAQLVPGGYSAAIRKVAERAMAVRRENAGDPEFTVTIDAPTNAEAHAIGLAVRELRREAGEIKGTDHHEPATDGAGNAFDLPLAEGDRVRLFAVTRAIFTDDTGRNRSSNIGDNGTVLEVVQVRPGEGLQLRNPETGKQGFVSFDALRDAGSGRIKLATGEALTTHSSQGITSDWHISSMASGSSLVQGFLAYVGASRHRVGHELIGSMGAEMRDMQARLKVGETLPADPTEAAWAHVAKNLSRQPMKESAMAFLEGAARMARTAAETLQRGARRREANVAQGKPASPFRETLDMPRARETMNAIVARLDAAMKEHAPIILAMKNAIVITRQMRAKAAAERLTRIYARAFNDPTDETPTLGEAADRIVAAVSRHLSWGLPRDPVHNLPIRPKGEADLDYDKALIWATDKLIAAIDAYAEHGEAAWPKRTTFAFPTPAQREAARAAAAAKAPETQAAMVPPVVADAALRQRQGPRARM